MKNSHRRLNSASAAIWRRFFDSTTSFFGHAPPSGVGLVSASAASAAEMQRKSPAGGKSLAAAEVGAARLGLLGAEMLGGTASGFGWASSGFGLVSASAAVGGKTDAAAEMLGADMLGGTASGFGWASSGFGATAPVSSHLTPKSLIRDMSFAELFPCPSPPRLRILVCCSSVRLRKTADARASTECSRSHAWLAAAGGQRWPTS